MKALAFLNPLKAGIVALCLIFNFSTLNLLAQCNCDYYVPNTSGQVTYDASNVQPGEVICLQNGPSRVVMDNFNASVTNPIIIAPCGNISIDTLEIYGGNYWLDGEYFSNSSLLIFSQFWTPNTNTSSKIQISNLEIKYNIFQPCVSPIEYNNVGFLDINSSYKWISGEKLTFQNCYFVGSDLSIGHTVPTNKLFFENNLVLNSIITYQAGTINGLSKTQSFNEVFIHNTFVTTDSSIDTPLKIKHLNQDTTYNDTISLINNLFYHVNSYNQALDNRYNPYFMVYDEDTYGYTINDYYQNVPFFESGNVFTNTTSGFEDFVDWKIGASSLAINAGINHSLVPQEDHFGNPRVLGNRPDAGYHEWHPENGFLESHAVEFQGIYCKIFEDIIIDSYNNNNQSLDLSQAANYLSKLKKFGFNYLIIYGLGNLHWNYDFGNGNNSTTDQMVADFINLAKTEYGIIQVAATGEKASSFNKIVTYNVGKDYFSRIDVLHYEYEFWNVNNWPEYQASYNPADQYLNLFDNAIYQDIPASGPPNTDSEEHIKHFSYMYNEVQKAKDIALNNDLVLEYYASRTEIDGYDFLILPNNPSFPNEELLLLANFVDRFCLAHYTPSDPNSGDGLFIKPTDFSSSNYIVNPYGGADRYEKLGSDGIGSVVMPIFHGSTDYTGHFLHLPNYELGDAIESFEWGNTSNNCGFYNSSVCPTGYQYINYNTLAGSIWYKDEFLLDASTCIKPAIHLNSEFAQVVIDGTSVTADFSIIGELPVDINVYQNSTLINSISNWNQSEFQIHISNFSTLDQGLYTIDITPSTSNPCYNASHTSSEEFILSYSSQKKGSYDAEQDETSNTETSPETPVELTEQLDIVVYPNPTIGELQIQNNQLLFDVTIVDQAGRVLYSAENCPQQIDLKGVASAGLYYFVAKTEYGIYRKSIVVQ